MELLDRDRYAQKPRARETAGWGAFRARAPGCGGALDSETQPEKARQDREMIAQGLRLPDYSLRNPGLRYLLPKKQETLPTPARPQARCLAVLNSSQGLEGSVHFSYHTEAETGILLPISLASFQFL